MDLFCHIAGISVKFAGITVLIVKVLHAGRHFEEGKEETFRVGYCGQRQAKSLQITELPLTDLSVLVDVDSILRVSLYAAKDRDTTQRLIATDDYLASLEELPVLPSRQEKASELFMSGDSEAPSPAMSDRSSLHADAYFAGECVVPIRAVGERFGGGMIMQWIALDPRGLRTDGCLEGDARSDLHKVSALFRDLLSKAQTELWNPKICISVRDAEFPFEDRLPLPTQVAVMRSRRPKARNGDEQHVREDTLLCCRIRKEMPCFAKASNGLVRDDEYVRALTKNLEATTRMLYSVVEQLDGLKQRAEARRDRPRTPRPQHHRRLSLPRRHTASRSLSNSPRRADILASLREFNALSVDRVNDGGRCLLGLLVAALAVRADLPVHCEMNDIAGLWTFSLSEVNNASLVPSFKRDPGASYCGISAPGYSSKFMRAFNDFDDLSQYTYFPGSRTFNITLSTRLILVDDGEATQHNRHQLAANTSGLVGSWDMVFDEGFEVRIGAASLFAVSRYRCTEEQSAEECFNNEDAHEESDGHVKGWESLCGETFIGWYHVASADPQTFDYGCWYGRKMAPQSGSVPLPPPSAVSRSPRWGGRYGSNSGDAIFQSILIGQAARLKQDRLRLRGIQHALDHREPSDRSPLASDLLELFKWQQPDSFRSSCNIDRGISELPTKTGDTLYDPLPEEWDWRKKLSGSWNVPLVDQGSCGSCYAIASTYALQSRINIMLIGLALNSSSEPIKLSTESILACSWYNQACNGGLEVLALRHAQEMGVIEESKLPYTSSRGNVPPCPKEAFEDPDEVWYAKDYGYVGGFYGQCSELQIMRNLYEFGPMTVSLHAKDSEYTMSRAIETGQSSIHAANDSDTIGVTIETDSGDIAPVLKALRESRCTVKYVSDFRPEINPDGASGVFYVRSRAVESWSVFADDVKQALDEAKLSGSILDAFAVGVHGWEYVDHSVALVGWGSELDYDTGDERPYWLIRNSWSSSLPGGGYVKLRRGTDAAGLESGSVWVEPDMCQLALLPDGYNIPPVLENNPDE
ncbi:hypothetical protein FOZ61_003535 [Perkinsus olseni]|uniref:Dipeptidyl peptidase 1 n=1 Tax=Perkinsus olseni TaxID=32597 RepID=A0A7J6MDD0_PEROL|nr:hypothetical protein FOZ61_003535 [Perkinsus olseni]